jgi:hypothetical protein
VRRLPATIGLGIALAVAASFTTAFSTGAEVVTAVAIAAFVLAALATRRPAPGRPRRPAGATPARTGGVVVWGVLAAAALAFELGNYFCAPRAAHPTVSYFLTAVAAQPWSRGIAFAAWLALGDYLVRR